ncbi:hypothetical protein TRAPUB_9317 [Trametes pubescens]|uniref:Uncharacterized protein n=1 Tax=Trametes pubescens TaxID=154538 RepID=A0A1M2W329_TRAPU|nr:hypothetical protein TRAPUB_9317 [Trametes pubescens]
MSDPKSGFDLDISGVAGFFGGDVSVSAMATVHVYEGRKWLGWYNQPGSYEIAKRYGQLSRSRFWDALYPGANVDPAVLFEFDGKQGPKFTASQSGTVLPKTTHVARLFAEECKDVPITSLPSLVEMRRTTPGSVTIANLTHTPHREETPRQQRDTASALACIPILISLGACVGCVMIRDWYAFACILLGIVSSGLSCFVIGMGTLKFKHPDPAPGAPAGDGVLESGSTELVILKGPEGAVNAITRGQFTLDYDSKPAYHNIGLCSMLLTLQFVVQLLLIPQSEVHGQLFFLATLFFSWVYNSYLSSLDRENIQRAILRDQVLQYTPGQLEKYELGTRTSMVTFALLLLAPAKKPSLKRVLDDLLPNDTEVWGWWKSEVLRCIDAEFHEGTDFQFTFGLPAATGPAESTLLDTLYKDARAAAVMYNAYRKGRIIASPLPSRSNTLRPGSRASTISRKSTGYGYYEQQGPLSGATYGMIDGMSSMDNLPYGQ